MRAGAVAGVCGYYCRRCYGHCCGCVRALLRAGTGVVAGVRERRCGRVRGTVAGVCGRMRALLRRVRALLKACKGAVRRVISREGATLVKNRGMGATVSKVVKVGATIIRTHLHRRRGRI